MKIKHGKKLIFYQKIAFLSGTETLDATFFLMSGIFVITFGTRVTFGGFFLYMLANSFAIL
jgi:hypothetical protein